jgi:hypothetical protein
MTHQRDLETYLRPRINSGMVKVVRMKKLQQLEMGNPQPSSKCFMNVEIHENIKSRN